MNRTTGRRSPLIRPAVTWLLVVLVIGVVAVVGSTASDLAEVEDNGPASQLPRGFDSTLVVEEMESFRDDTTMPTVVVFHRPAGLSTADLDAVDVVREALREVPGVHEEVAPAIVSDDGQAAALVFGLDLEDGGFDAFDDLRSTTRADLPTGLDAQVTGPAAHLYDEVSVFDGIDERILIASIVVVIIMLLFTYRSPMLWALPLAAIGVAMVTATGVIYLLGTHGGLTIDGQSNGIMPILVFGVGTDYALLYLARYREALHHHTDRYQATRVALHRAAPPILASAATTVVGLGCLMLADLNSTRSLGAVCAIGVGAAAVAILIVLPLLLLATGRWVFWPAIPRADLDADTAEPQGTRVWRRLANRVSARPRAIWVGTAAVLFAMFGGLAVTSFGTQDAEQFRDAPEAITGQELFAAHFDAGASTPVDVITDNAHEAAVINAAAGIDGITDVVTVTTNIDGSRTLISATTDAAADSDRAEDTVRELRESLAALPGDTLVGGVTAEHLDVREASGSDLMLVVPLVLAVVALVLAGLLRAVLGPVVLLITVVGSYVSALGLGVLIMSLLGFSAVDIALPLLAFVFLVALGVDYTIFLTTRIREETATYGHAEGVRRGLIATGGVITGAGLVLAATFSILIAMPLVFMIGLGVVVALGILLDTFVVRTLLVPALMLDLGPRFWWPRSVWSTSANSMGESSELPPAPLSADAKRPNEEGP